MGEVINVQGRHYSAPQSEQACEFWGWALIKSVIIYDPKPIFTHLSPEAETVSIFNPTVYITKMTALLFPNPLYLLLVLS